MLPYVIRWEMSGDVGRLSVAQSARENPQKEWRRPVLRKLPISATANKGQGNEGLGVGKGDNVKLS
jgi:hypothetical protein